LASAASRIVLEREAGPDIEIIGIQKPETNVWKAPPTRFLKILVSVLRGLYVLNLET
jgi:hypothetical protein